MSESPPPSATLCRSSGHRTVDDSMPLNVSDKGSGSLELTGGARREGNAL